MIRLILLFGLLGFLSVNGFAQYKLDTSLVLSPENIIKITFENSNRIKSAYYYLQSAKSNFKLFESDYTQFNPIIVGSGVTTDSEHRHYSNFSAGMRKEFFDGTSIEASVGNDLGWGKNMTGHNVNYIQSEISFPLFTSARKLDRLIKRTFEENELYTKNLDYVDAVKENIHDAVEQYYDLVPRIKIYNMLKYYRAELQSLYDNELVKNRDQIEGEIAKLDSKIAGFDISLYSMQLSMERYMNVEDIDLSKLYVIDLDFNRNNYFGSYYIEEPTDSIFAKALSNDSEFKVLGIIKQNAEEKKRLAEKGKWDIFATTGARYNYYESKGNIKQNKFLVADAGLKIKLYDNKVLKNTIAKAESDIQAIDYIIRDREKLIRSNIEKLKDGLTKKKDQLIISYSSVESWKNIYETKKTAFLAGTESVDNFIQAFRSLVETEQNRYHLENNYLDLIRDFNYITGAYFEYIELKN